MWANDINKKGGLLGRPVQLVYYDDQSNPALVPGIYSKLLDVDKVTLVVSGYASTQIAAAMPLDRDPTRGNEIDVDAVRAKLTRPGPGQPDHRGLGCNIVAISRIAHVNNFTADVDHPPDFPTSPIAEDGLQQKERRLHKEA